MNPNRGRKDSSSSDDDSNPKRRFSVYGYKPKDTRKGANPLGQAVHDGVLLTGAPRDSSHIVLKELSVTALFDFLYDLAQYQTTEGVRLNAAPRVERRVIYEIVSCREIPRHHRRCNGTLCTTCDPPLNG